MESIPTKHERANHKTKKSFSSSNGMIHDILCDVQNLLKNWDFALSEGFSSVSQASNIKLQLLGDSSKNNDSNEEGSVYTYNNDLSCACQKLISTCNKLQEVIKGLHKVCLKTNRLHSLEKVNRPHSSVDSECVDHYSLWSITDINDSMEKLLDMFVKQLQVNKSIVENIAHVDMFVDCESNRSVDQESTSSDVNDCRDLLMTYSSLWLYQPYINSSLKDEVLHNISCIL